MCKDCGDMKHEKSFKEEVNKGASDMKSYFKKSGKKMSKSKALKATLEKYK